MDMALLGLLDTSRGACLKVHDAACSMMRIARRGSHIRRVEVNLEVVSDFLDRGYKVSYCKCCKISDVEVVAYLRKENQ